MLYLTWFGGTSEDLFKYGVINVVDTTQFFLVVVDAFGNGISSSPSNHPDFPRITIGDMVKAQHQLLTQSLDIPSLHAVMGTSMGGMQTFEWVTQFPTFMDRAITIVGSPRPAAYDQLLWQTQLQAITQAADAGNAEEAAAMVGMISTLALHTPQYHALHTPVSQAGSFIHAAQTGVSRSMRDTAAQLDAMLSHDISRRAGNDITAAAKSIQARMLNIVDRQDHMVTPEPALQLSTLLGAETLVLDTHCGHMTTRCEGERIDRAIRQFLSAH
ncbi:homoserine O-acetyltransferase [Simiduia agarivorans SA1 = DSM 21679]|uniref:Homoserine O-acetyltransferase n=1 Tax=Simiduia agarivorans (strain DSM 21679 / JCM 13881 / BCRC 17597 / SA1) TaxID=1117647 RepID=K4L2M1_SIMAS|nr:homoserine O-acetyltransferase [Simiduia agarivorans SA1 = DSM 21679]